MVTRKEAAVVMGVLLLAATVAILFFTFPNNEQRIRATQFEQSVQKMSVIKTMNSFNLSSILSQYNGQHFLECNYSRQFYLYKYPVLTQMATVVNKTEWHLSREHVYSNELRLEAQILAALEHHPLRTLDPNNASIYVVPTPIGQFLCRNQTYDYAFRALTKSPIYKQQHGNGNRHVIVAITDHFFNKPFRQWFNRLKNVTIVRSYDPNACKWMIYKNDTSTAWARRHDYYQLFHTYTPNKTTRTMSIGLSAEPDVPLIPASFEKYQQSKLFLFYRTTPNASKYGSTRYRHKPVEIVEQLSSSLSQPSSIGYGIPHDQWLHDLMGSKFCLVIRGDTPHSHALFSAIRVGCIPVIISDWYPIYAPPFKSTLNMWDYCIFVPEKKFITAPVTALVKRLERLTAEQLEVKLRALAVAQQVIFTDHPKSLFVEAFIEEVFRNSNGNITNKSATTPSFLQNSCSSSAAA